VSTARVNHRDRNVELVGEHLAPVYVVFAEWLLVPEEAEVLERTPHTQGLVLIVAGHDVDH
jgi:hypothetical protein